MQVPSDVNAEVLEAFYARVMRRVCDAYREEDETQDADATDRLEQKWRETLGRYIGRYQKDGTVSRNGISVVDASSDLSVSSSRSSSPGADAGPIIGQPSAKLSAAASTPSSVFARMLGGKRKLHQLDGSVSDEDGEEPDDEEAEEKGDQHDGSPMSDTLLAMIDEAHYQGAEDNEGEVQQNILNVSDSVAATKDILQSDEQTDVHEDKEEKGEVAEQDEPSIMDTASSTSLLVSEKDLVPVSGLSGSEFPLQLAAEYTRFRHRGKRQGYFGELRAIVLTWPSRLGPSDTLQPGELVWCYGDRTPGPNSCRGVVEVLSLGDTASELNVKLPDGNLTTVPMTQVRRLREYLIRKGTVRLRSEQQ